MSNLSATSHQQSLSLHALDSRGGLIASTSTPERHQQPASIQAALFQGATASDSKVLDIQSTAGTPANADTYARNILAFVGGR
ncbi:MAG: hypothetical protein AB8B97_12595 [Granulosicoccus sp.]